MNQMVESLSPIDEDRHCVNVVVETPKGSRIKYAYDPDSGLMVLSKTLPAGMVFPFNFGFVPGTVAEDGDPLDMLLLNEEILVSGCLVKVRPLGIINAYQDEGNKEVRNDRVVGEALTKEEAVDPVHLKLEPAVVGQIETFFSSYNKMYGKTFTASGTAGEGDAWEAIHKAIKAARSTRKI